MLVKFFNGTSKEVEIFSGAKLSGANLSGTNLFGANLFGANLFVADLSGADLSRANLSRADLSRADLSRANLSRADFSWADLSRANLSRANLSEANLSEANLSEANLSGANLSGANLSGANLSGANLLKIKVSYLTMGYFPIIPPGKQIVYKRIRNIIVTMEVPEDAYRSNATTRKCRVSKAKVISISNGDNEYIHNAYNHITLYKVGEMVYPDRWDDNRWNECSNGIHCFLTREEAESWRC